MATNYFSGGTVDKALSDNFGNATLVRSTVANIPSAVSGYAIGCLLQATDTGGIYTNTGTAASATFTLLEDAGGSFTLPTSATDASTTTTNSMALTMSALTTGNGLIITAASATTAGVLNITSPSSNALVVGLNGKTNPVLQVDASTASQAAGLKITGAVAAGSVALAVISSGADASLTLNAKGTGTIGIGSVSTGAVTITPATTVTGLLTLTAGLTSAANAILKSATAVPATAGAVAAGAPITMYSGTITIEVTSDAPTHVRAKGSLCIATNGSSATTRIFINTDGSTGWTSITTAT